MLDYESLSNAFRGFRTANSHATRLAQAANAGWNGARAIRIIDISLRTLEGKGGEEDAWYGRPAKGLPGDAYESDD